MHPIGSPTLSTALFLWIWFPTSYASFSDRPPLYPATGLQWQQSDSHNRELAPDKSQQRSECLIHEPIGVQSDTKHVHAKPGKASDHVAEYSQDGQTALSRKTAPACMQDNRVPKHD